MAVKGYRYARLGPIASVLALESFTPVAGEVTVAVKKAPIHRGDAAVISGTAKGGTNAKDAFPRIGGSEAFGTVTESSSSAMKKGTAVWVAPPHGGWAQSLVVPADACHTVKDKHANLAPYISALLTANRLLKATKLPESAVVIQNGGSSVTSLAVSALAQSKGFKIVTAAAPGARFSPAASRHKKFGSELVEYTPAGARKAAGLVGAQGAHLYLNGVGGHSYNDFQKLCAQNGTAVTYGAQHGFGLMFAGSQQIYKNITMTGFSLPRTLSKMSYEQRQAELDEVLEIFAKLKFDYPVKEVSKLEQLPAAWDEVFIAGGQKAVLSL